jgi:hypothetical protein
MRLTDLPLCNRLRLVRSAASTAAIARLAWFASNTSTTLAARGQHLIESTFLECGFAKRKRQFTWITVETLPQFSHLTG